MSMLAEPRRKQKWSVDPRNSAWSKDESKFGQKMLERMGWSKGKGLGRTEQGSTEHIKVKVKNNNLGLGTAASHEDNWIAHQDDFNQLLADLNNCHGQNDIKEPPTEEKQSFSLEQKSKTSKKRVHYMKFTKGKDLSSRSDTDLACIFGKRATHSKTQKEESSCSDSQGEEEEQEASLSPDPDVESITKTVTSTLTMQEYFAQRMALLRKGRDETQDPGSSGGPAEDYSETQAPTETSNYIQNTTDDTEQPKSKRKKKKKKREETAEVVEEAEEEEVCAVCPIVVHCEDQETPSQKKRKRKRAEKEDLLSENCNATPGQEQNCEEEQTPTQKKKKKKRKETSAETDLVNGQEPTKNETEDQKVVNKKKKKKQREHVEEVVVVDDDEEEEDEVVEIVDDNDEVVEIVERKSKKHKKKKKNATIASS
ncbi:PIN2/TERF1-interacting telomerase inhibitor 1 [Hypomesus transpacificus]|uniref:PIN2/TERF1-interacting telomerase inhibitor 1 n=1 Tax=Hypomesus transpacificus TaxID=137520 RepID=UPI001F0771EF|nr:PIN2/TERF1-interacting telomerase inhibitor 1 [Hypomesus transpacificus]